MQIFFLLHIYNNIFSGLTSDTACESLSRLDSEGESSAGAAAVRWGTWGAARALRASLRARRLHVVLLHTPDLSAAELYSPPMQLTPASHPARYVLLFIKMTMLFIE